MTQDDQLSIPDSRWRASRWLRIVTVGVLGTMVFVVAVGAVGVFLLRNFSGDGVASFDAPCDILRSDLATEAGALRSRVVENDNGFVCRYNSSESVVVEIYANPIDRDDFAGWANGSWNWETVKASCDLLVERQRDSGGTTEIYRLVSPREVVSVAIYEDNDVDPLHEEILRHAGTWAQQRAESVNLGGDC